MKAIKKKYLFNLYTYYWIFKLGLNKYLITVNFDKRYDACAITEKISNIEYNITYNLNNHGSESSIISTVLHELGHLLHPWTGCPIKHEEYAELFSLETIKSEYPLYYRISINRLKKSIKEIKSPTHIQAYKNILKKLKEI